MRFVPTYLVKTPKIVKWFYGSLVWNKSRQMNDIYLTFDDGPTPEVTIWVLDILDQFDIPATFFCIGKNVSAHPHIYQEIVKRGHSIGNHTYNHLNGWTTDDGIYLSDIERTNEVISSTLFRPPYGRIKKSQIKKLKNQYNIIMWDVLSGDFDQTKNADHCIQTVTKNVQNGSIIVFHDSEKAFPRLKPALKPTIEFLLKKGYNFKKLSN